MLIYITCNIFVVADGMLVDIEVKMMVSTVIEFIPGARSGQVANFNADSRIHLPDKRTTGQERS